MKYTTKQEDGTFRTVDTDSDSLFTLITEAILDWFAGPYNKRVKNGKK